MFRLTLSGLGRPCVTNLGLRLLGPLLAEEGEEASELFALALFPALRRAPIRGDADRGADETEGWPSDRPLLTSIQEALRLTGVQAALGERQGALALRAASEEVRERLLACGRPPLPSEANQRAVAFTALAILAAAGQLPGHDPDQLWDLGEHWSLAS